MTPARYFYYFILDGYFESHNPNEQTCVEPTRKLTLNILDYGIPSSPSSSSSSSRSSRRSSPASSISSPTSSVRSSKRSGGVYDIPSPLEDEPYYHSKAHPHIPTGTRRTPSPRRQHAELSHIVHPKPRNPLAAHKLTLDTNYYHGRPVSVLTTAATTAGGESPISSRSSSSCSGSSFSSRGSSPVTPLCQCDEFEIDTRGHYCEEYGDEDYEPRYVRYAHAPAPKGGKAVDADLAYRLERGLRM
jgi:hypothetical protein